MCQLVSAAGRGRWQVNLKEGLGFTLKIANDTVKFCLFVWTNAGKFEAECIAGYPANDSFINPQRPVQTRDMQPAFERHSFRDRYRALDLAPAHRDVERATLALALIICKSAPKLRRKTGIGAPLARHRFSARHNGLSRFTDT